MMENVITRLDTQVADLTGKVEGAAAFAAMMKGGRGPHNMPAAFVLPLGLQGGRAEASSGMFVQSYAESIGVVLFLQATDPQAERALDRLRPLIAQVIDAIAGWAPGNTVGVFGLSRGALIGVQGGRLAYQIDFSIQDQLRIAS
ncbi:phage tail terminator protein [Antarcticimicrobium sediminis]|uniref:Uncharacterized protein n=1 Tax=Antarcticimicrobium sediminis TaxID=2546227 RepID=A0A4R5F1D7_9RHOB|nr:hypothetical protein [Antarcticimicrobium sediminis]TDE40927.1 hypothetical protein E1B25_01565 [Antarcticimicrobium sediminis]